MGPLASALNKIAESGDIPGVTVAKTSPAFPTSGSLAASFKTLGMDNEVNPRPTTASTFGRDQSQAITNPMQQTSLAGSGSIQSVPQYNTDFSVSNEDNFRNTSNLFGNQSGNSGQNNSRIGFFDPGSNDNGSSYSRAINSSPQMGVQDIRQRATQPQTSGGMASLGGDWAGVDALNDYIQRAAAETGVDPNLIKAVMKLESGGEWIISHAGAVGYMQVVPEYWGHLGFDLNDPYENILAGAYVLKYYIDSNGGDVYEALRGYHGYGFDQFTTDRQYADIVMGNLQQLRSAAGGSSGYVGTGPAWSVMFGGTAPQITQEMGLNSWSQQHLNGMYAYGPAYGITGHAGIDVGMTYGSALYAPTSGVVIRSGGTGYYCDDFGCGPGQGELRIQLDNGDQLILGHMSNISVAVGQRVNAGMFVGKSGTAGSGAHVHVEYRTRSSSTSSGWKVVDPRSALGGTVTATGGGGQTGMFANRAFSQTSDGYEYAMRAYFGIL